jgi:hypothetical protein
LVKCWTLLDTWAVLIFSGPGLRGTRQESLPSGVREVTLQRNKFGHYGMRI